MQASRVFLLFFLSWNLLCAGYAVAQQEEEKLTEIQQQIREKQASLQQDLASAKSLQAQLKQDELRVAEAAKRLNHTQTALQQNQTETKKLNAERQTLQQQLNQQQAVLAEQLRSAYMAGDHDYAKMVFNLNKAGEFERMLSYYQYLSKERQQQIDTFRTLGEQLAAVVAELASRQQELETLASTQLQQKSELDKQQKLREITLGKLNQQIASQAAQVEQLQINEQSLLQALQEAQQQQQSSNQQPVALNGLARLQGKLPKPVSGRMDTLFGKRRQGQVRWKGVMIYANAGDQVKAVDDARVLYADWLKGFGLVIALDHGDGYMSLYGHNQALLLNAGDTVRGGDTIALVGQSGGQSLPGLYFEIRHKGEPVNPGKWLVR